MVSPGDQGPEVGGAGAGSPSPALRPPAAPTITVPPVWVRRGFSTFLCTRKLGRRMRGGISVIVATAKDHCGERRRPLAAHGLAQRAETATGKSDFPQGQVQVPWVNSGPGALTRVRNRNTPRLAHQALGSVTVQSDFLEPSGPHPQRSEALGCPLVPKTRAEKDSVTEVQTQNWPRPPIVQRGALRPQAERVFLAKVAQWVTGRATMETQVSCFPSAVWPLRPPGTGPLSKEASRLFSASEAGRAA